MCVSRHRRNGTRWDFAFSHRNSRADVGLLLLMVVLFEDCPLGIHDTAGSHGAWFLKDGEMNLFSVCLK